MHVRRGVLGAVVLVSHICFLSIPPCFFRRLYVGGGVVGTTDEEAEAAGGGLAEDLTGGEGSERRRLGETLAPEMEGMKAWRKLQATSTSEDPCVILAMPKAGIKLPLLAGDLVFADAVGGFCNFSPEETGVRCTPSGFFFNVSTTKVLKCC